LAKARESSAVSLPRRLGRAAFGNAYLLLTLTALFWAGNLVVGRWASGNVPPVTLSAIRWLVAAAILTPFAWTQLKADWPVLRGRSGLVLLLCLISAYHVTLNYVALNYTTALNALTLNSITPILIVLISFVLFGERMRPVQLAGIGLSFIGALIVITHGDLGVLASLDFNIGDLLVVFTMAILALYTSLLRRRPDVHWLSFTAVLYLSATLFNAPFSLWELASGQSLVPTPATLGAIAYVSIFPSLLAYIFYNRGVELIGSGRAGAFLHLTPLFGAALAIVFLGERLEAYHVAGFVLIVAGVALAAHAPKPL
jgi:drug/metabolite transporter (DMT)-like permease